MWYGAALSLELKQRAMYVADFWVKMIVPPIIQVIVAYYLWEALFLETKNGIIGGYTFPQMIRYYVIAAAVSQMVMPEVGIVLRDIYEGTITKYLFYPLSFFQFKFAAHLSQMILISLQLVVAVTISILFFPRDAFGISLGSFAQGIIATLLAGLMYFLMAACLEVLGFWVETVWGLVLMLQFVMNLLSGKLIPLSVFPNWLVSTINFTPFPYIVSFPTRVILGEVDNLSFVWRFGIGVAWSGFFALLSSWIWRKGSYHYAGTGM